jgi:hypothetical protein
MAEIRETHVERDADGNVVDTTVTHRKKGGGFGFGMFLGVILIAGALLAFAYTQGSFQQAGVEADQATAQVEQQTAIVAENAGDVVENAGDTVEQAGDNAEQATN